MSTLEFNFDGLVGPTHNYAGLAYGNLASTGHVGDVASPRRAALQGLQKMQTLRELGVRQAVLPPLRRPRIDLLRSLGFSGSDQAVLESAWKTEPALVAACFSASSMWTANAGTVSPSADCSDRRLHFTPANLSSGLHRMIEAEETFELFRTLFPGGEFVIHRPLPAGMALADEGAANHTRLCPSHAGPGVGIFVFGQSALDRSRPRPVRFPARQTMEASQAVARSHGLDLRRTVFLQQSPDAIDAGVFHNDVIAVGNERVFLYHEGAFLEEAKAVEQIRVAAGHCGFDPVFCRVTSGQLSLRGAVTSYLFNSQLVSRPDGRMALICPIEVEEESAAQAVTRWIVGQDNPIDEVHFLDLRQSMNNGGGPACLRLRVVLDERQQDSVHQGVLLDDRLYSALADWVGRHYREELCPRDLLDPLLRQEIDAAYVELAGLLGLPLAVFGMESST